MADGRYSRIELHALVRCGHESGTPVSRPVGDRSGRVGHHHEPGQVGVLRAEPVIHPRSQAGSAAEGLASVHLAHAAAVVDAVGPARTNYRQIIRAFGGVRQPIADPQTALSMAFPLALAGQNGRFRLAHGCDRSLETVGHGLAGQLLDERLGIKQIHVARAAFHEEKNHPLGFGRKVRLLGCMRIGGGEGLIPRQHAGQRQRAKAGTAAQ